ncbi:alpha-mannosidase [Nocardioides gansuensis]|uniref:Alpha-mannosidase n=2 Tax=Nocardioides gansuensis TaxID=2138300 RepID=A0A2T8F7V2_9ACTN|nr:alpha-mannosidase [Nocardioides gansuensis]
MVGSPTIGAGNAAADPGSPGGSASPGAAAQSAAAAAFASSFETTDRALDWTSATETRPDGSAWTAGVTGATGIALQGDVTDQVAAVTANAENAPNEIAANLVDGDSGSKWLTFTSTGWVRYELGAPAVVQRYSLTAANDAPERDPRDWVFQGSQDGTTWTDLDARAGQDLGSRFTTTVYDFANATAYKYYRLDIRANHSGGLIQLAELRISNGDESDPPARPMHADLADGPASAYTARTRVGFTGVKSLRYGGKVTAADGGHSWNKVYDVEVPVTGDTELSYRIFPNLSGGDLRYPSTYAAVDLAFTDGTYLSELGVQDQNGFGASPREQGESRTLYVNQWNHRAIGLGAVAAGKTVDRILVGYDSPHGPADFGGFIDDIEIAEAEPVTAERPSDWVVTTRGTNSTGSFSRGNNIPAAAVPHGFNFWSPVTNAGSLSWIYGYAHDNDAQNRTRLQALALSHETSPWMGDRHTFQVMPSVATGVPTAHRTNRSLPFSHVNEVASPHHYAVTFDNGLKAEIAPTDHAAIMRFTFPDDAASLVFDNVNDNGGLTVDPVAGTISGWTDTRSGLSVGAHRMFVHGVFDSPVTASGLPTDVTRPRVTRYVRLDAGADRTVELRLATSLISLEQARKNLQMEVAASSFEQVKDEAQAAWDDVLDVIEVEGATPNQLTTLYSNLYRLSLYPNSGHENVGTPEAPVWKHASPVADPVGPSTPVQTGAKVVDGKIYVNNGFWDTYRTTWPAYSFLYPEKAGEMVDGFVQQFREGGWVSRWSSPGYANLMTGTSSDISFADAFTKGVEGFDPIDAYDAALKNATVAPPGTSNNADIGRKGLQKSIFLGWTPDEVSEGVSWALEGYINDHGIGRMAVQLSKDMSLPLAERLRYKEEAAYFLDRSRRYVEMFDSRVGFFQGRDAAGEWKSTPAEYDPEVWGHSHDYTETNGWNFAFHVPFDGAGLAALYGGRDQLAKKLDTFFATPETGTKVGSYGGVIHEMIEARDVRMGMWGFSNQVSHHIPWMYTHTGQPSKTQKIVREVLSRHYLGSEIGQGYAGDEDNGETSAWWIFSALGFYPLELGSERYAVGSPLFTKATVHLENGEDLVIEAPGNSAENVYVQGVTVDGSKWDKAWLAHKALADGGVVRFTMGPQPSRWATGTAAVPPSPSDRAAAPLTDATGPEKGIASGVPSAPRLFDNTSGTVTDVVPGSGVQYRFLSRPVEVSRYTITSGTGSNHLTGWVLEGSDDGTTWTEADRRKAETFRWAKQTRPFEIDQPRAHRFYRLRVTGLSGETASLAEVELFGLPGKELTDEQWVAETLAGIDLGDTSALTGDVELPTGPSYAWASADTSLVTDEGRLVRRPDIGAPSEATTLTVTVTKGEASGTRDFTFTVAPWTQAEWEATGTDLATSFEEGQPGALHNAWLRAGGVVEFCCGIGGMETTEGGPPPEGAKTGGRILLYSGLASGEGPASATNAILDAPRGTWVRPGTQLSWWVFPEGGANRRSTYVALDLQFTDGTFLQDLRPTTTDGQDGHPSALGTRLANGSWQQVVLDVGSVAAGKQVQSVAFTFDSDELDGPFRGFVDDVVLERPAAVAP